jgi:hypothetical protein
VLSTLREIPHLFPSWRAWFASHSLAFFGGVVITPKFGSQNFCSCRFVILNCFHYFEKIWGAFGQENCINGRRDPLRWPRDILCPQKLALTSSTSGDRSVGIVRLRTKDHGVFMGSLIRSPRCVCVCVSKLLTAGILEPEKTAVTTPYKRIYDMRHDSWKPK